MNIKLHIERLVLEGLEIGPGQGAKVKIAVEAELSRILAEGGLSPGLQGSGAMPSFRANPVRICGGANPSTLGEQIARSIYGGIGK
jgi:hypothetical protein